MRSEGYCSWVCVSVCVSFKSHLTYGASVRPENAVTYSAGNKGQNICGVFSETAPLQRSSTPSVARPCVQSAIFPAESTHVHYSIYHVVGTSKDRVDTPPAELQSMCESVCSLISIKHVFLRRGFYTLVLSYNLQSSQLGS